MTVEEKTNADYEKIAEEVLALGCRQLLMKYRFLEHALYRLIPQSSTRIRVGTDGKYFYYHPNWILQEFASMQNENKVALTYMHTILHCVFLHPYLTEKQITYTEPWIWNIAADICVENILNELELESDAKKKSLLHQLHGEVDVFTVWKLYYYLLGKREDEGFLEELATAFARDEHGLWWVKQKRRKKADSGKEKRKRSGKKAGQMTEEGTETSKKTEKKFTEGETDREESPERKDYSEERMKTEETEKDSEKKAGGDEEENSGENKLDAEKIESEEKNIEEDKVESGFEDGESEKDENRADLKDNDFEGDEVKNGETENYFEDGKLEKGENDEDLEDNDFDENETENTSAELEFPSAADSATEYEWQQAAERIQMDMESFSSAQTAKLQGTAAGDFLRNLTLATKEKKDYSEFLRKFTRMEEVMCLDPDEFDYVYYTYGLQLYKKIALIEPLEYRQQHVIKDFVIAIDTSGSCDGEIVQKFLTKTYQIMHEIERLNQGGLKFNIHIIQCDAEIQDDVVIQSIQELESYVENLQIKGLGGTDFRPVFEYVDDLISKGQISKELGGLIYFTDGYGTFPTRPRKYKTAFVFISEDDLKTNKKFIPPWAIALELDKEEIKHF